jgi:hypothetical protein
MAHARFRPPPGWPEPVPGWVPAPDWRPPEDWPPAPAGWQFWDQSDAVQQGVTGHDATASAEVAAVRRKRISWYQKGWLIVFWAAAALSVLFVLLALTGSGVPSGAILAVVSGAVAAVAGALMASMASRRGINDVEFDGLAKGMRVAVVAWVILMGAIVIGAMVGSGFGSRPLDANVVQKVTSFSESVTSQIFGFAVLFSVVGDGYTSYRKLVKPTSAEAVE